MLDSPRFHIFSATTEKNESKQRESFVRERCGFLNSVSRIFAVNCLGVAITDVWTQESLKLNLELQKSLVCL